MPLLLFIESPYLMDKKTNYIQRSAQLVYLTINCSDLTLSHSLTLLFLLATRSKQFGTVPNQQFCSYNTY